MHNEIIHNFREKPTLTLTENLREQYRETFDLIINHEWMIDLLNSKLSLNQFESFIVQEAYIYDLLARQVLNFAIHNSIDEYDELMRVGIFLYSESAENIQILNGEYDLSCPTKSYCEGLEKIWNSASYSHKILTLLFLLWIREEIYYLLKSEHIYIHQCKVWSERVINNSPEELVGSLSRIFNQSFIKTYGSNDQTPLYQENFKDLENLLSNLIQFELSVRNHAYQINFNQYQQSK